MNGELRNKFMFLRMTWQSVGFENLQLRVIDILFIKENQDGYQNSF